MTVDGELFADVLPTYLSRFIGRTREIAEVEILLRQSPIVTISGVGGAGKTRLAIEVAKRQRAAARSSAVPSNVYWIALAAVRDVGEVPGAMAAGVGLSTPLGGRPNVQLYQALKSHRALIVLDNCEHVASACREMLSALLDGCPELTFLVTSRVPLGLRREGVFPIPPLSGIEDAADDRVPDAHALFIDRCAAAAPTYALTKQNTEAVTGICTILHGLPLGIELAASWIPVLSAQDLLEHLQHSELTVSASAPGRVEDRHRSLQSILAGTWKWLSAEEQEVLSALSVFVGGFSREAAEEVACADLGLLSRLSERAVMQRIPDSWGGTRYHLHELVRSYAASHLRDEASVRRRHLAYFLRRVESLHTTWDTPIEPAWSEPMRADIPNIDAAALWAIEQSDADAALRTVVGLDRFWVFSTPSIATRRARIDAALALPWRPTSQTAIRTRAMAYEISGLRAPSVATAIARCEQALALFAQVGDEAGVAACLRERSGSLLLQGNLGASEKDATAALEKANRARDAQGVAWAHLNLGCTLAAAGALDEAVRHLRTSAALFDSRNSPLGACHARIGLAAAYARQGDWDGAVGEYGRALSDQRSHRLTVELGDVLDGIANVAAHLHQDTSAARLLGAAAAWSDAVQEPSWFPLTEALVGSTLSASQRRIGAQAWNQAFAAGAALSTEQAMQLAEQIVNDLADDVVRLSKGLSKRELVVLRLVAEGNSDSEIATVLVVSKRTVQAQLRSVFAKLNVSNRTAAVRAMGPLLHAETSHRP